MQKEPEVRLFDAQVKSRERVRDLAEVYTRGEEIDAMLNLVGDVSHNIEARFLEPACGNGNFLVRILERKLAAVLRRARIPGKRREQIQKDFEFYTVQAVGSIYAVDICQSNVVDARERMRVAIVNMYSNALNTMKPTSGFWDSVAYVLSLNIIEGDMLNGVSQIMFTEFSSPKLYKITQRVYALEHLLGPNLLGERKPYPIKEIPMNIEPELFTKVTGLKVSDFEKLCEVGVFNPATMNSAIFAFKRFEEASLTYAGGRKLSSEVGGFDTVIMRSELPMVTEGM